MGDGSRGAVWFGASGFEWLSVHDDEDGLVLEVETSARDSWRDPLRLVHLL